MNHSHKGNALSKSFVKQLTRAVRSLDIDKDLKAMFIKGSDLSTGTDLLYLAKHFQTTGNVDHEYLRELYTLIHDFATIDTPIIPLLRGKAYGAGAVLAGFSPYTIADTRANIRFPEAAVGFIPSGGASFMLSRMPGEIGTYLAMTGRKLVSGDAQYLKLVYKYGDLTERLIKELSQHASDWNRYGTRELMGELFSDNYVTGQEFKSAESEADVEEVFNRTNLGEYWKPHRENLRMVLADVAYKRQSEDYFQKNDPFNSYYRAVSAT